METVSFRKACSLKKIVLVASIWAGMNRVPIDENESDQSGHGGQKRDSRSEESSYWASRPVEGMVESSIVEDSLIECIEARPRHNPIHQGNSF